ncbi:MAG: hypothetical protein KBB77_01790 [Candidatus Moranbacteria bacterium]|jgi:hypothetical protein|nr:hypothetical protein [Candidatus Moranbacteria bacterium]
MIHRLPKKYKEKYQKTRTWDEDLIFFVFKIIGSAALLFIVAGGLDIYHLMH